MGGRHLDSHPRARAGCLRLRGDARHREPQRACERNEFSATSIAILATLSTALVPPVASTEMREPLVAAETKAIPPDLAYGRHRAAVPLIEILMTECWGRARLDLNAATAPRRWYRKMVNDPRPPTEAGECHVQELSSWVPRLSGTATAAFPRIREA